MPTAPASLQRDALITAAMLVGLLLWDATGLDLPLARWFGGPGGFAWHDHWLLTTVLHSGGRIAGWVMVLGLCIGVWWPVGVLRRLDLPQRLRLALAPLLAVLLVSVLKGFSTTSCPWDLAEFGRVARYVPHWRWAVSADGGSGHCFPAGHAASGFAFVGGWFVFRARAPRLARGWLAAALAAGFVLGLAQQVRGAHFMSHTLWSAWWCWGAALVVEWAWPRRRPAPPGPGGVGTAAPGQACGPASAVQG